MAGLVLGYFLFVAIANVIFSPSYIPVINVGTQGSH